LVTGILLLLAAFLLYILEKVKDNFHEPFPPFEDQDEFWEYHVKLSGITDPTERRRFEAAKKRELLERQRKKNQEDKHD